MTKKVHNQKSNNEKQTPVFIQAFHYIENAKRSIARFLQLNSDKLSFHTKKKLLISIGLLITGLCIARIINVWSTNSEDVQLSVGSLVVPQVLIPEAQNDSVLTMKEYQQYLKLKNTLDSLDATQK